MKISKLTAALFTVAALGAHAQSKPDHRYYTEVGYTSMNYTEPGYPLSPAGVARIIVGAQMMENLSLEGMAGFGVSDGSLTISGINVKGRVDSTVGLYGKYTLKLSDAFDVFGRIGVANSNLTVSVPGTGISLSDSGGDLSYGFGASVKITDTIRATLDYMSYYRKDGITADGVTFGLGFSF